MLKILHSGSPAVTALLMTALSTPSIQGAAAEPGKLAFNNRCRTCHSVKEGDNRLGPSLHGILGAKAGASSGYPNYSQSLRNAEIVWNEETLDRFIENPDSVIPGNNMKPYGGLPDEAERKEIIEYLKAQSTK